MKTNKIIKPALLAGLIAVSALAHAQIPVVDRPDNMAAMTHVAKEVAHLSRPWSGPAGSPEAAQDTAIAYVSLMNNTPTNALSAMTNSVTDASATVTVTTTAGAHEGSVCRFDLGSVPGKNAFGWEIHNVACPPQD